MLAADRNPVTLSWGFLVMGFFGGLALFLYGMDKMSEGMETHSVHLELMDLMKQIIVYLQILPKLLSMPASRVIRINQRLNSRAAPC